jgi:hypothetical protein
LAPRFGPAVKGVIANRPRADLRAQIAAAPADLNPVVIFVNLSNCASCESNSSPSVVMMMIESALGWSGLCIKYPFTVSRCNAS